LPANQGLMQQNGGVSKHVAFAFCPAQQEYGAHAGGHPHAIGADFASEKPHRVINCQSRGNGSAGRIDVKMDVALGILVAEKQ